MKLTFFKKNNCKFVYKIYLLLNYIKKKMKDNAPSDSTLFNHL